MRDDDITHPDSYDVCVLAIPNAVSHLVWYMPEMLVGTARTTVALLVLKPPLET